MSEHKRKVIWLSSIHAKVWKDFKIDDFKTLAGQSAKTFFLEQKETEAWSQTATMFWWALVGMAGLSDFHIHSLVVLFWTVQLDY